MATFSTNAEDTFNRSVDVHGKQEIKDADLDVYFDIEKCFKFIKNGSFEKVALQFPDDLLAYSFKVVKLIEDKSPDTNMYILGDTSYGSCCVDEVAAEHVNADCIIHFGRSCLSMTKRLPVLFVFGKSPIDVEQFCQNLLNTFENREDRILMFFDVVYHHAMDEIEDQLRILYSSLIVSKLVTEEGKDCIRCLKRNNIGEKSHSGCDRSGECCMNSDMKMPLVSITEPSGKCCCPRYDKGRGGITHQRGVHLLTPDDSRSYEVGYDWEFIYDKNNSLKFKYRKLFGRRFELPSGTNLEDCNILYIGRESLTLANLMISYNQNKFFRYDPERKSIQRETMNINKTLMKRYYLIQKAKEAKTIGIVAGTLGVEDYLLVIEHLKTIIKSAGKKYYTFMMGKPNIAKMANFMEIDIFVIVACPENSLIDSQGFYKPIITPFELEIACSRQRSWTGEYITDFREILDDKNELRGVVKNDSMANNDEPEYSLVSGNLIQNLDMNEQGSYNDKSLHLVPRSQENSLATFGENSSASFLQTRFWNGLEQKLGQTEVVDAVEGRTGIASGYTHEMDDTGIEHNESPGD